MTENLQPDPSETNEFILNAALNKEPIFEAYKKLCKIRRNPEIDYVDFEWKYYQYYHGNRDLTIEKSLENSSPVTFSDLQMDVLERLVGELPLVERLVVRKVSRGLRNLVDSVGIHCKKVYLHFTDFAWNIVCDASQLHYEQDYEDGCSTVTLRRFSKAQKLKKYDENRDVRQMMVLDASTFMKNPKLRIDRMWFVVHGYEAPWQFLEFLEFLGHPLNVRSICIKATRARSLPLIQFLRPGSLEEVHLDAGNFTVSEWNTIAETDQWKMARRVCWTRLPRGGFPMDKMLHFKEIQIDQFSFNEENFVMVRDILLKSSHLEQCYLKDLRDDLSWKFRAEAEKQNIDRIMSQDPAYDSATRRFAIPDSRDYFQLELEASYYQVFTARKITVRQMGESSTALHRTSPLKTLPCEIYPIDYKRLLEEVELVPYEGRYFY